MPYLVVFTDNILGGIYWWHSLWYLQAITESVTAVQGGIVGAPDYDEIVATTYTGTTQVPRYSPDNLHRYHTVTTVYSPDNLHRYDTVTTVLTQQPTPVPHSHHGTHPTTNTGTTHAPQGLHEWHDHE